MNKIAWSGVIALLALAAGAAEVVKLEADLPALAGRTRAQLSRVFPGEANTLKGWNEWSEVTLGFRPDGKVDNISFLPKKPLGERKARELLALKLNLKLGDAARATNKKSVRYIAPSGTVDRVVLIMSTTGDLTDLLAGSDAKAGVTFSEINVRYRAP